MISDVAAVPPEAGSTPLPSHDFECAVVQTDIVRGLCGVEKGMAVSRPLGPRIGIVIVHRPSSRIMTA